MKFWNVSRVAAGMILVVTIGSAVSSAVARPPAPASEFHNLQVLPKNISSKELNSIMVDEFEDALGVGCNFCHDENKDTHKPDYASDGKLEKEIARVMMRMTMKLNKQFFRVKHPAIGDSRMAVS